MWHWVHLVLIFSGFAAFSLAVASALLYLAQSIQLKSKHLGKFFMKLPSLEALDRANFYSLSLGVMLFSAGVLAGILWAKDLERLDQVWVDPRVLFSFAAAALYWVILALRASSLRRGQKIAIGTILVFGVLAAAFIHTHPGAPTTTAGF